MKFTGIKTDEELIHEIGLTEQDLRRMDARKAAYEHGEFPPGKTVLIGRPPLSDEELVTVAFKLPKSQKEAVDGYAKNHGQTRSQFLRGLIAKAIF